MLLYFMNHLIKIVEQEEMTGNGMEFPMEAQ